MIPEEYRNCPELLLKQHDLFFKGRLIGRIDLMVNFLGKYCCKEVSSNLLSWELFLFGWQLMTEITLFISQDFLFLSWKLSFRHFASFWVARKERRLWILTGGVAQYSTVMTYSLNGGAQLRLFAVILSVHGFFSLSKLGLSVLMEWANI